MNTLEKKTQTLCLKPLIQICVLTKKKQNRKETTHRNTIKREIIFIENITNK